MIKDYIVSISKKCLSWVFPYTCILCSRPSTRHQDLCEGCLNDFPILQHPCPQCAQPLPFAPLSLGTAQTLRCGRCQTNPPPYTRTLALFSHEPPVTRLILGLKFRQQLLHARVLGELLAEYIQHRGYSNQPRPDIIVPIPLHPVRLKERGFNQALEIAKPISKKLCIPLDYLHTQRIKHTVPQMDLPAAERHNNIKNAFSAQRDFSGLCVAVVDDVITTSNTVREFCALLRRHGAKTIHVWCCARVGATLAR